MDRLLFRCPIIQLLKCNRLQLALQPVAASKSMSFIDPCIAQLPQGESRPGESGQCDEWIFCLNAATIAAAQERR
jgi:hypothetical protein